MLHRAVLLLLALVPSGPALPCGGREEEDRVLFVDGRGEIVLASGRRAALAGLLLPPPGPDREEAVAWLRSRASDTLVVTALAGEDRWMRVPVRAVGAAGRLDLAHGLLDRGLAVANPAGGCHPEHLAIEAAARDAGLGVWSREGYKPVVADDQDALRARVGRFALVEGRIRSVGERRGRTYLNLGPDSRLHASVIVPQRMWRSMVEKGLTAEALRGRRVRARGVLDWGWGPAVEIAAPEALEYLDGGRGQR